MVITPVRQIFLSLFAILFGFWSYSSISAYFASKVQPSHDFESLAGFGMVIIVGLIVLGVFHTWDALRSENQGPYRFSLLSGFGVFLGVHFLCLLSYGFLQSEATLTALNLSPLSLALSVFFRSLLFLLLPFFFLFLFRAVGAKALDRLSLQRGALISSSAHTLLSVMTGVSIYLILLTIIGALGYMTLPVVALLTLAYAIAGVSQYREVWQSLSSSPDRGMDTRFSHRSQVICAQLFALAIMIFFSSNIISIFRPMPIGWDDLGVYMNYPRLIALSGDGGGLGLVAWQHFTSLGFLLGSPTQAFFLSELGGLLLLIGCFLGTRILCDERSDRASLWPIVVSAGMLSLPMVVFHLAKDMKVDPALMGISIASFVAIICALRIDRSHTEVSADSQKKNIVDSLAAYLHISRSAMILLLLAGGLAGVAFAIKLTTIMLFIAGCAMIAFRYAKGVGLMIYSLLFVGVFTLAKLWAMMNVDILSNMPMERHAVGIICLIGALVFGIYSCFFSQKGLDRLRRAAGGIILFALGFILAFSPWVVKNLFETSFQPKSVGEIISGRGTPFVPELSKIYTPQELEKKDLERKTNATSASGTTTNEDFGRYFGYEQGINNAMKLPLNLTTQVNQSGEFTNIGFFFLALVPLMCIALVRSRIIAIALLGVALFFAMYYFTKASVPLTQFFSQISYPAGYLVLFGLATLLLALSLFGLRTTTRDDELERADIRDTRLVIIALAFYGFLFWVSSYGIVWYGILVYFLFFLVIVFGSRTIDRELDAVLGDRVSLVQSISIGTIALFVFASAIPHAWTNISQSGYLEYKVGKVDPSSAVFYHDGYLPALANLNISNQTGAVSQLVSRISDEKLKTLIERNSPPDVASYVSLLDDIERQLSSARALDPVIAGIIQRARVDAHKFILNPPEEFLNSGKIYRIGTFLTYFIRNNTTRYLEDSLVMEYGRIIHDENDNKAGKRLSDLSIKYLLLDLNAATIDRDPSRNLTTRFEGLLANTRSDRLRLVYSDSTCLKLALDAKSSLSREDFLMLAHTNSESYVSSGSRISTIPRAEKLRSCRSYVEKLLLSDGEIPEYLSLYRTYIREKKLSEEDIVGLITTNIVPTTSWMALFEVIPEESVKAPTQK